MIDPGAWIIEFVACAAFIIVGHFVAVPRIKSTEQSPVAFHVMVMVRRFRLILHIVFAQPEAMVHVLGNCRRQLRHVRR